jgi:hypothetical protein
VKHRKNFQPQMHADAYLKATGLHLCLLLNFGKSRLEIQRIAHDL